MPTSQPQAKTIFLAALEVESENERQELIEAKCGGDEPLRDEVHRLLAHADDVGSFLESPPPGVNGDATVDQHNGEQLGTQIGPYKLLQQLGEGGMGTVYLAERQHPVKQRVALKIIKHGMDSKQFVARFEAERQALAMMDHPNIAKVLDAGCTGQGRPYFVMELVKGIPISEFCDENRLTTRERLELFVPVCQAVHHAHQKGIIHRDLKPSNVLVALYDDKPVPKVIDFGVAKATNQQLTEKTLFTEVGSILGTWEYMSPEQAVLNQLDVDTRSDVYSLGVLLYELLTGETPLDRQRLREAQVMETLRMIREDEPLKPSTRVSSLGQQASTMAAYRKSKPESLASEIRGDLDWIVMKVLAKERSRRYDSASRFAEDVERFLANELVEARPPSTAYRAYKIWKQHKRLATSVFVVIAALAIGLAGTVWQWRNARLALQRVDEALQQKDDALKQKGELLENLHGKIVEQALLSAILGEAETSDALIKDAEDAGVPPGTLKLLEGVAAYHSGKDALGLLEEAWKENQSSVIAFAMLTIATAHDGDRVNFEEQIAELKSMSQARELSDIEQLFAAYPLHIYKPESANPTFKRILKDHPSWVAARMFLAGSLGHEAMYKKDAVIAKEAVEHARAIELVAPDSPFGWMACLWTYHVAIAIGGEQNNRVLAERADALAAELKAIKSWRLGSGVRGLYLLDRARYDEAYTALEQSLGAGLETQVASFYAVAALQLGGQKLISAKEKLSGSESPWAGAALNMLKALEGKKPNEPRNKRDLQFALEYCWAHLIRGDSSLATEIAKDFQAQYPRPEQLDWSYRNVCLDFLASEKSKEDLRKLKQAASGSHRASSQINFTLGLYELAEKRKAEAHRLLSEARDTGQIGLSSRLWATAILDRWSLIAGDDQESEVTK